MFELNKEELEKVTGGFGFEKNSFIHKCKYELAWTKQKYLDYCRSQGATEAEVAVASLAWDMT